MGVFDVEITQEKVEQALREDLETAIREQYRRPDPDLDPDARASPWLVHSRFRREVDYEHLEMLTTVYRWAAEEARSAGDLAGRADRLAVEAGLADGAPLVDGEQRGEETSRGTQGDGEELATVARLIQHSLTAAKDTEHKLKKACDSLDVTIAEFSATAQADWWKWTESGETYSASDADFLDQGAGASPNGAVRRISYRHRSWVVPASATEPPQAYTDFVLKVWLTQAKHEALSTLGRMAEVEGNYRATLIDYGAELVSLGFPVMDGPLGLWNTPDMARFAAAEALRAESDDTELMMTYLHGVAGLMAKVQGGERLTPQDVDYLHWFVSGLGQETMLAFAEAAKDAKDAKEAGDAGDEEQTEREKPVKLLADAFMVLMDPRLSGLGELPSGGRRDDSDPDQWVQRYMQSLDAARWGIGVNSRTAERFPVMERIALLLDEATVPPGDRTSQILAKAAVNQNNVLTEYEPAMGRHSPGSDTLLTVAARNKDGAAGYLADEENAERFFRQQWYRSEGAAALVDAATDENVLPHLRERAEANIRRIAEEHPEYIEHGDRERAERDEIDHAPLREAVERVVRQGD
ncbi:hypothetical protein [Streptomyces sp. NPDC049879]|uniref:hypothetical protein n=1 Tax=Streptomyces sp. NPDC049879 TaxID=3365598 RepID=UPI0037AAC18C